jgi:Zn-dependent protease/anti-sigma regulatory factor (Ser/Thr protein kinase)
MNKLKESSEEGSQKERGRHNDRDASLAENRIGMIISSKEQISLAQDFATDYCNKLHLGDKFIFELHLIIEEFLISLFDNIRSGREIPFYLTHKERGIRIVFDISGTGFRPVFADFSPLEFERDEETEDLIGLTVLERIVDNIKHIRQADKDEVHFIMYIGDEDFKDVYGFRKRHPVFRKDVIMSEVKKSDKIQYNLRLKGGDDFFSVSEREYFIIQMLDGKHELSDMIRKFTEKYGNISPKSINRFINTLEKQKLLEPELDFAFGKEYQEKEVKISLLEKILSFQYSIPNVDKLVTSVYKKFKWMLTTPAAIIIALSLAAFFYELYHHHVTFHLGNVLRANAHNPWIIVDYYAIMLFTVVCHEFAHALTCKKYGGEVHRMGIMLYYFQVCAYADTSDAWLFKERYKRILTALNGPVFSLFLASLFLWFYYLVTPISVGKAGLIHSWLWSAGSYIGVDDVVRSSMEQILIMVTAANILVSLFNILPFTEMDGYYILSDLTNSPHLRNMSMGYVLNFFRRLFKKPPYPVHASNLKVKIAYTIFGSLCLAFGGMAVAFVLYFLIFMHNIALHSVFGIFLCVTLGFFCLKGLFLKRIHRKREFLRRKVMAY